MHQQSIELKLNDFHFMKNKSVLNLYEDEENLFHSKKTFNIYVKLFIVKFII